METSELLRKVRRIEIKTRRLSRHFFSGDYHSAFKGRGMSFSEVRAYQYGDEVRNIDWNVTARTGDPHVKVFEEERELTIMLAIDISPSVFFGTVGPPKQEWIAEVAAVLGFSALQNNDKAGLLLFSDKVDMYIPPRKGKQHLLRLIRELINVKPSAGATDLRAPLAFISRILKQRSIVFMLSDFIGPAFEESLDIAARRHEIIGLHVADPAERRFPRSGLVRLADPETGRTIIADAADGQVRRIMEQHRQYVEDNARGQFVRARCGWLSLQTDEPYVPALHRFFKMRASS
jgi:uncharacterized protein (DUF58 family)